MPLTQLVSQPLIHGPYCPQSKFSKTRSPVFIMLHGSSPPPRALGLQCRSVAQHALTSIIWVSSTLPTSPLTFPLLFQPPEWLTDPPTSCNPMANYLCIMPCPLSTMILSFLLPFTSLTYNCSSGFSPPKSIL